MSAFLLPAADCCTQAFFTHFTGFEYYIPPGFVCIIQHRDLILAGNVYLLSGKSGKQAVNHNDESCGSRRFAEMLQKLVVPSAFYQRFSCAVSIRLKNNPCVIPVL